MIELELNKKKKLIIVKDEASTTNLHKSFYGKMNRGRVELYPEEVLYIMDIRNGRCYDKEGNNYSFNELASIFSNKTKKIIARYLTYKDWRDKGLIARPADEAEGYYGRLTKKKYEELAKSQRNFMLGITPAKMREAAPAIRDHIS